MFMSRRHGKLSTTRTATAVMTSAARTTRTTRRKRSSGSSSVGRGDCGESGSCGGADVVDASSTGLTGTATSATHHPRRSGGRVRPRVRILCETAVAAAATSALVMMLLLVPYPPADDEGDEQSAGTVMRLMMTVMDAAVTTILWSTSQLLRSTLPFLFGAGSDGGANGTATIGPFERNVGRMEEAAWTRWERRAKLRGEDPDDGGRCGVGTVDKVTTLPIPVLDFACPGGPGDDAGVSGPGGVADDGHHCIDWEEEYARFRSAEVAGVEYDLWKNIGLTLDGPILLRNLWNATATIATERTETGSTGAGADTDTGGRGTFHPLSLVDLSRPPLGDLPVQLYSDSSRSGPDALRPDAIAPLRSVVKNVTSDCESTQKIGTQIPVLSQPELIYRVAPPDVVRCLFGDRFRPEHVETKLGGLLPALTTVPIFLARGRGSSKTKTTMTASGSGGGAKAKEVNVRTDLHCEPIGNVAVQLHGERRWTLISPRHSRRLRPTVSRHGRAFFHSTLDPASLLFDLDDTPSDRHGGAAMMSEVPRYEVVTRAGDAVWVPPWTWHRIDYVPGVVSLGASLFHFRPWEFVRNNPLFAALVVPNLIKELVQMKTE